MVEEKNDLTGEIVKKWTDENDFYEYARSVLGDWQKKLKWIANFSILKRD